MCAALPLHAQRLLPGFEHRTSIYDSQSYILTIVPRQALIRLWLFTIELWWLSQIFSSPYLPWYCPRQILWWESLSNLVNQLISCKIIHIQVHFQNKKLVTKKRKHLTCEVFPFHRKLASLSSIHILWSKSSMGANQWIFKLRWTCLIWPLAINV